ncbi:uncharacterized protein LOC119082851 [Bradysia coprophila]|uniref:uncharacterized protein LOC119082851 n=1 Tax=Bradysia coprophila TaxID=38358 RepID=UPI00187DCCE6|nr:uncharacterized protein LOC119082851 [Bradysia coprophila]
MKYFVSIIAVLIFQSIRFSFACYGCDIDILELESGLANNVKFEKDFQFELSDDCKPIATTNLTMDRIYTTASISLKFKSDSMDLYTLKNKDLCKYLSDFNINVECPAVETGRKLVNFGEKADISDYGPFLPFFLGNFTILLKVCYDGDENNPDVFKIVIKIRLRD